VGVRARGRGETGKMAFALAALAGVAVLDVMAARQAQQRRRPGPMRDYSDRSGFARPAAEMRGAARQHAHEPVVNTPAREERQEQKAQPQREAAGPQAPSSVH
jgi:hypothetical protein